MCILVGAALLWLYFKIKAYAGRQFMDFHVGQQRQPSPPPQRFTYAARWVRNQAKDRVRQIAQLMDRRAESKQNNKINCDNFFQMST